MSEPSGVYHAGTVWVCQGSLSLSGMSGTIRDIVGLSGTLRVYKERRNLSGTLGDYQGHCGSVRYIAGL